MLLYYFLIVVTIIGCQAAPTMAAPAKDLVKELAPGAAATKSKSAEVLRDGVVMEQSSLQFGDLTTSLSAAGIKVVSHKQSLSMLCAAPFNQIIVFSERTHKYFASPFASFRNPMALSLTVINNGLLADTPLEKKEEKTFLNQKVQVYHSTAAFDSRQIARFNRHELPARSPASLVEYVWLEFKIDPRMMVAQEIFLGLPKLPGIPLLVQFQDLSSDKNNQLITRKLTRIKLPDSTFKLPLDYKATSSNQAVLLNTDTDYDIKLMFGDK